MTINTYGLTEKEMTFVSRNMPVKNCEVISSTSCFLDLIAVPAIALIIRLDGVEDEDLDIFWSFYAEVEVSIESIILIGEVEIPENVNKKMTVVTSFEELEPKLKYILLTAYKHTKKDYDFSKSIANALTILSMINKHPGIKTSAIAEELEISSRSVQRYIETLRIAGEFIEYDKQLKGWVLSTGTPVLWELQQL